MKRPTIAIPTPGGIIEMRLPWLLTGHAAQRIIALVQAHHEPPPPCHATMPDVFAPLRHTHACGETGPHAWHACRCGATFKEMPDA